MSGDPRVGSWAPEGPADGEATSDRPSVDELRAWVRAAGDDPAGFLAAFPEPPAERAWLMKLPEQAWADAARALSDEELLALVRVFTLAEVRFPGWEAGEHSPVIPMARELRRRGAFPSDVRRWVREHTDNRFLPFGSLQARL